MRAAWLRTGEDMVLVDEGPRGSRPSTMASAFAAPAFHFLELGRTRLGEEAGDGRVGAEALEGVGGDAPLEGPGDLGDRSDALLEEKGQLDLRVAARGVEGLA